MAITFLLSSNLCIAQIKNAKTETVKIYGNCGMCEKTIEKAGTVKKVASVEWDKETKMATITYDAKKTNQDEILKRIALAGYDSDRFQAPDDVYENLHGCCHYDRPKNADVENDEPKATIEEEDHSENKMQMNTKKNDQLSPVFDHYFEVKDALVKTDGAMASVKAKALVTALKAVKMDKLEMDVHNVWMKVMSDLQSDAEHMAATKDASKQREYFVSLSKNMYALIKVSKTETPTYYQYCPMANEGKGANWLSKENAVKNPYYGTKMLGCGKVVETIN